MSHHRITNLVVSCFLTTIVPGCKGSGPSMVKTYNDSGIPTLPVVKYSSSDQKQTVTFVGMVHVAPVKFYADVVASIAPDAQKATNAAAFLEGIKCSKSWIDIQQIVDQWPLQKADLTARFSDDELKAAANGFPSKMLQDYIVGYVKSWIDQNHPEQMVTQVSCAEHESAGTTSTTNYVDAAAKLKATSGVDWVFQYDKNNPLVTYLASGKVTGITTDVDNSDLDLRNPIHLLYSMFASALDESIKFPADPAGNGPWEVMLGTASVVEFQVRDGYALDALYQNRGTYDHVILPWGVGHLPDFMNRLAAAGFTQVDRTEIVYDDHCAESTDFEKLLCNVAGK